MQNWKNEPKKENEMRKFLEELNRIGFKSVSLEESHGYCGDVEYTDNTLLAKEGEEIDQEMREHADHLVEIMHEKVFEALKERGVEPEFGEIGGLLKVEIDIPKSLEKGVLAMKWESTDREETKRDCSGDSRTYSWGQFKKLFKNEHEFEVVKSGLTAEREIKLQYTGGGDSGSFHEAETENNQLVEALLKHEQNFLNLVTHDWYNNEGGGATIEFNANEEEITVSGYGYYNTIEDLETQQGEVEVRLEEPQKPRPKRQGPSAGPGI